MRIIHSNLSFRILNAGILISVIIVLATFLPACQSGQRQGETSTYSDVMKLPVLQWTAWGDPMNFRYDFTGDYDVIPLYMADPDNGAFSHHSYITWYDGVFYAAWDNHIRDENGSGQRGLMRRSYDGGQTWTDLEELFPPQDEMLPAATAMIGRRYQTLNGFVVVDGMLYAMSDVADWEGPSIRDRVRVSIGRLCRAISPDGSVGDLFWLAAEAPEPVSGFEAYPAGDPDQVAKINHNIKLPGNEIQLDFTIRKPRSDDNHRMTEPVPSYRLSDGTWVKIYRDMGLADAQSLEEEEDTKSRRNYVAFSFDDGHTWTTPTRTSFPDACARSDAGMLPDGQYYVINNMLPLSTKLGGRMLLGISLSYDGLNYDRAAMLRFPAPTQRYQGRAKAIGYQYPNSVVVGDDLWIMYSVNKEDIELMRISLSELQKI
jgi:hypothetical protein